MKIITKAAIFLSLSGTFLFLGITISHAQTTLSLGGKNFNITMFCMDSAGDYCNGGSLKEEEFMFEDDGDFQMKTFEDEFFGFSSSGSFEEEFIFFTGHYESVDEDLEQYKFDFSGINLSDTLILGIMNIAYYKFQLPAFNFELEDETTAYFLGTR